MNHYILLSSGDFDDYEIEALYACDHPIDKDEWKKEFSKFRNDLETEKKAIYIRHGGHVGYGHIPAAHAEYIEFMHKTHPLKRFVEKHNLVKLAYIEINTWGMP